VTYLISALLGHYQNPAIGIYSSTSIHNEAMLYYYIAISAYPRGAYCLAKAVEVAVKGAVAGA